jgi:hypothetical protein
VCVGILIRQSTKWTSLYHGDQLGPNLKVFVTNVDSGLDGHVGNSQDRELTNLLLDEYRPNLPRGNR